MPPKKYEAIDLEDNEFELQPPNERPKRGTKFSRKTTVTSIVGFFTLAMVVILLSSVNIKMLGRESDGLGEWRDCGNSTAEAKAAGCVFDIMLNGWIQPECYHKDMSEEFIAKGKYRIFSDKHATVEVSMDVVRKGEHTSIYTAPLHHFDHCAYMWSIQAMGLKSRLPVDTSSVDYEHTVHCAHVLETFHLKTTSFGNESTIGVAYMECGPYRKY